MSNQTVLWDPPVITLFWKIWDPPLIDPVLQISGPPLMVNFWDPPHIDCLKILYPFDSFLQIKVRFFSGMLKGFI